MTTRGSSTPSGAAGGHAGPDGPEEAGQALDAGRPVQVGQHPRQGGAVDQGVAQPRRGLGPVRRPPGTRRPGPARRRRRSGTAGGRRARPIPTQGRRKAGWPSTTSAGIAPLGHQRALAVEVGVDQVEQGRTRWATAARAPAHSPASSTRGTGSRVQGCRRLWSSTGDVVGGALVAQQPGQLVPPGDAARSAPSPSSSAATCVHRGRTEPSGPRYSSVRPGRAVLGDRRATGRHVAAPTGPAVVAVSRAAHGWVTRGARRWSRQRVAVTTPPLRLPADEGGPEVGVVDPRRGSRPAPPARPRGTR